MSELDTFPSCGHPRSPANAYRRPNGVWVCRRCSADRVNRHQKRQRAELRLLRQLVADHGIEVPEIEVD